MSFLEKIKPHLLSDDIFIQETVLRAIHDYPNLPEEWTIQLLKKAFDDKEEQSSSIFIYIDNETMNQEALEMLIENTPKLDPTKVHLLFRLVNNVDPELAWQFKESLEGFIREETWELYELIVNGTEEAVKGEYEKYLNQLESLQYYEYAPYSKAKKLAKSIVKNGWISANEIDKIIQDELKDQWFSYRGILAIYMIGLLKMDNYIPTLASLLVRDEDILLEEAAAALIAFQNDDVVEAVAPYLKKRDSVIFATSVAENIKSDLAVKYLREAYHATEDIDDQDIIVEALCYQLSSEALPEISDHMKKGHVSQIVDLEQTAYGCYSILGEHHLDMESWKREAFQRKMHSRKASEQGSLLQSLPVRNENKVGRNDPCPCGSGKKYKKCCGK
ncbi:SEC-C metal-binding domain-containing protein [Neobacillus novalis]|uniref:SEC-C metal-binding domain-containing protein n=1 Tax=Neobacillus novalis TaxID=220687 RepID=A0AA95MNS5_9BACI|nr:SEC-C metal-binding domain-containing protein [Neobacillus novalis]WHY84063.1 SEC-C metal-binding domain-containing protein [Neobacillus novalis]